MFLIPEWLLALTFFLAAASMAYRKRWEHVFTRLVLAGFYLFLAMNPGMEIEITRMLARWFILVLATVEIISFLVIFLYTRKQNDT
jgi:heme/copper-type cytochrome/quinol oxidase subunit 4